MYNRRQAKPGKKAIKREMARVEKEIKKIEAQAKRLVLSAPPGFIEELSKSVRELQAELVALEADPSATPESKAAKVKELDQAKGSLRLVQETLLSTLAGGGAQ